MRILALETSVEKFTKKFLIPNEEIICTTHLHWIVVVVDILVPTFMAIGVIFLTGYATIQAWWDLLQLHLFFILWWITYGILILNAIIHWRYNFFIVTTEKVIVVRHRSIFAENVDPAPLEDLISTNVHLQFLGIFQVGKIHIALRERKKATSREMILPFIPHPNDIAAAVENAIVLKKQRMMQTHAPRQQEVIRSIQEKISQAQAPHE